MNNRKLQIDQLDRKLKSVYSLRNLSLIDKEWIKTMRSTLGMSLQQIANRLFTSRQSIRNFEKREKEGKISLNSLNEIANAMEMDLVYVFIPKDGSLEALVERKAKELATKLVLSTSNSMMLEDQKPSDERIEKAIEDRTLQLKLEIPKMLWD